MQQFIGLRVACTIRHPPTDMLFWPVRDAERAVFQLADELSLVSRFGCSELRAVSGFAPAPRINHRQEIPAQLGFGCCVEHEWNHPTRKGSFEKGCQPCPHSRGIHHQGLNMPIQCNPADLLEKVVVVGAQPLPAPHRGVERLMVQRDVFHRGVDNFFHRCG